MDPGVLLMIREILRLSAAVYFASGRVSGKTDEEIKAEFEKELARAIAFDPNTIKDV